MDSSVETLLRASSSYAGTRYFSKSLDEENLSAATPRGSSNLVYREKEYTSASDALQAYIDEFDGSLSGGAPRTYQRSVHDLLTPRSVLAQTASRALDTGIRHTRDESRLHELKKMIDESLERIVLKDLDKTKVENALAESTHLLRSLSADNLSSLPADSTLLESNSEIDSMTTDMLLSIQVAPPRVRKLNKSNEDGKQKHVYSYKTPKNRTQNGLKNIEYAYAEKSSAISRQASVGNTPTKVTHDTKRHLSRNTPTKIIHEAREHFSRKTQDVKQAAEEPSSNGPVIPVDSLRLKSQTPKRQSLPSAGGHPPPSWIESPPSGGRPAPSWIEGQLISPTLTGGRTAPSWIEERSMISQLSQTVPPIGHSHGRMEGEPPIGGTLKRSEHQGGRPPPSWIEGMSTVGSSIIGGRFDKSCTPSGRPPPSWIEETSSVGPNVEQYLKHPSGGRPPPSWIEEPSPPHLQVKGIIKGTSTPSGHPAPSWIEDINMSEISSVVLENRRLAGATSITSSSQPMGLTMGDLASGYNSSLFNIPQNSHDATTKTDNNPQNLLRSPGNLKSRTSKQPLGPSQGENVSRSSTKQGKNVSQTLKTGQLVPSGGDGLNLKRMQDLNSDITKLLRQVSDSSGTDDLMLQSSRGRDVQHPPFIPLCKSRDSKQLGHSNTQKLQSTPVPKKGHVAGLAHSVGLSEITSGASTATNDLTYVSPFAREQRLRIGQHSAAPLESSSLGTDTLLQEATPSYSKAAAVSSSSSTGSLDASSKGMKSVLEETKMLLESPPAGGSTLKHVCSPDTDLVLEGDRPWEQMPISFKQPKFVEETTPSYSRTGHQPRIVDQFLDDCLASTEASRSPTYTGRSQPGTMEALKNMLFRLQTEAPPSEQESNYVGAEADKENVPLDSQDLQENSDLSQLTVSTEAKNLLEYDLSSQPGGQSLERALLHLSRLKSIVQSQDSSSTTLASLKSSMSTMSSGPSSDMMSNQESSTTPLPSQNSETPTVLSSQSSGTLSSTQSSSYI